jgi:hypothetical protein
MKIKHWYIKGQQYFPAFFYEIRYVFLNLSSISGKTAVN